MVTIMRHATVRTLPASYLQACDTFRPRRAAQRATRRTSLSAIPFIDFHILAGLPNGFVFQHSSKARPASIQDGFRHLGFSQLAGIDITNDDAAVGSRKSGGFFVEKIFSRIGDFGVNGSSAFKFGRLVAAHKARQSLL